MTKRPKTTGVITDEEIAKIQNTAWANARTVFEQERQPQREREEFESFKRSVRSGDSAKISEVIFQALTRANIRADVALREFLAEEIDAGRIEKLNTQLRFYLVQYLVHPLVRPLQSWVRE